MYQETIKAIRVLGLRRFIYCRFIYRHHMQFIHAQGRHQYEFMDPMSDDPSDRWPHYWCQWCGDRKPASGFGSN